MMILCERSQKIRKLLEQSGIRSCGRNLSGNMYSINLKDKLHSPIAYKKERPRKPIIELTQDSLDQMLLLHSLGMSNQEIIEVIKGEEDV